MTKPILAFLNLTHGTDLAQEAWFGSMSVSEVRATDHNGLPFYLFFVRTRSFFRQMVSHII